MAQASGSSRGCFLGSVIGRETDRSDFVRSPCRADLQCSGLDKYSSSPKLNQPKRFDNFCHTDGPAELRRPRLSAISNAFSCNQTHTHCYTHTHTHCSTHTLSDANDSLNLSPLGSVRSCYARVCEWVGVSVWVSGWVCAITKWSFSVSNVSLSLSSAARFCLRRTSSCSFESTLRARCPMRSSKLARSSASLEKGSKLIVWVCGCGCVDVTC